MGLKHVFGEKPVPVLPDLMLVNRFWDCPISELSRKSGVSYRTLQKIIPQLVRIGFVKETRTVANAKFYQINLDNPAVRALDAFALQTDFERFEKSGKREHAVDIARVR